MAKIPLFTPRKTLPSTTASTIVQSAADTASSGNKPVDGNHTAQPIPIIPVRVWRVLIVDDDEEIHTVTKLVLRNFEFEGRNLVLLHATSAAQAREHLANYKDIAV